MNSWTRIVAVAACSALAACNAKARLKTETKQTGATLEVKIEVDPPASGTLTFTGQPAFAKLGPQKVGLNQTLTVNVPLNGVPVGKNSVGMHFEGTGRGLAKNVKADGTLDFDRTSATPELRLAASASKAAAATLPCNGLLCSSTSLPLGADGKLYVDMSNCDGCMVEVGNQKIVVKGDPFPAAIDMMSAVATIPVAGLNGFSDAKIPFKVTRGPDSGELDMEGKASSLFAPILQRIVHGGLLFAGEAATAATAPKAAILVRKDDSYYFAVVGAAKTMHDADLIGVAAVTKKTLGTCGVYEGTETKKKVTVTHDGESYDFTMYDRRTGKTVGHRMFPYEDKGCADKLVSTNVTSSPSYEHVVAWATRFLR